jgi:hypothetical protein
MFRARWTTAYLLTAAALFVSVPRSVQADFIYTYTGNPFDDMVGIYNDGEMRNITATFEMMDFNPVPGSNQHYRSFLKSYSISDDFDILTDSNSILEEILWNLDANRQVLEWSIIVKAPVVAALGQEAMQFSTQFIANPPPTLPSTFDSSGRGPCFNLDSDGSCAGFFTPDFGQNFDAPGIWTVSSTVPEPATLLLLTFGIAGLLATRRRG